MRSSDLKVIFFKKGPKIQCFDQDFEKNNLEIGSPPSFFDHFA